MCIEGFRCCIWKALFSTVYLPTSSELISLGPCSYYTFWIILKTACNVKYFMQIPWNYAKFSSLPLNHTITKSILQKKQDLLCKTYSSSFKRRDEICYKCIQKVIDWITCFFFSTQISSKSNCHNFIFQQKRTLYIIMYDNNCSSSLNSFPKHKHMTNRGLSSSLTKSFRSSPLVRSGADQKPLARKMEVYEH